MNLLNTESEQERIRFTAKLLHKAAKPVSILKTIGWPAHVKIDFFAKKAKESPQVTYPSDPKPSIELIRQARRTIFPQSSNIDLWLKRLSSLRPLFCGKLDLVDIPALGELTVTGFWELSA